MMSQQDKLRRKRMLKIKTYKTFIIFLVVLSALFAGCGKIENTSDVSAYVREFKDAAKCDGVSVVTLDRGELSYYGDESALYQIVSMTKETLRTLQINMDGRVDVRTTNNQYYQGSPAGHDLVVIYETSTRSMPAQTTPIKLVVLCDQ